MQRPILLNVIIAFTLCLLGLWMLGLWMLDAFQQPEQKQPEQTQSDQNEPNKKKSKSNVGPELKSILPPHYPKEIYSSVQTVFVSAILDISATGEVTRIASFRVKPHLSDTEPVIKAVFLARFEPRLDEDKPVATDNFTFYYVLDLAQPPAIEADPSEKLIELIEPVSEVTPHIN